MILSNEEDSSGKFFANLGVAVALIKSMAAAGTCQQTVMKHHLTVNCSPLPPQFYGLAHTVNTLKQSAYCQSAQTSPRRASNSSFMIMGSMMREATGSAHHQLNTTFRASPPNNMAER